MKRTSRLEIREVLKTPRRKSYTIVGLTILTVAFFLAVAIRPTLSKVADVQNTTRELEKKEEAVDKKLASLRNLQEQRDQNKEIIELFEKNFPEKKDTPLLVANFEKISEKYELLLTQVTFDDPKLGSLVKDYPAIGNIGVVNATITVEGELDNIKKYIEHLENYPRPILVRGFIIRPVTDNNPDEDERNGYSAEITTDIFYFNYQIVQEENND